MQNFEQLRDLLTSPKRIVITSHANPDGDALGASLGLYHYLKKQGHRITVIMPTEMPQFLNWMKDFDKVLVYENTRMFSAQILKEAEVIFALDYNDLGRIEGMSSLVGNSNAYKVMIDHHIEPKDFCNAVLSDVTASSTCQLIYEFIEMMDGIDQLDESILNALYVGILTDTGGFRYATSARLFRIVANMLENGIDNNKLTDLVFNSYTVKSFNLLAYCISDCLELMEEYNTGIITISQADHKKYNIQRGDLEGVVNFILKIRKMRCAALITERRDIVKLSLRSKGDFSVQKICSEHFNGGGHKNASGGAIKKPFKDVIAQFKEVITQQYKEELTKELVVEL
ncbi:DHH family phosphoesterase [Aureispira anguillae]|uniref:DHH family phosphoesterase n=1 Tax=Aureispira anguillae TaxID=2864201 RepID=A0A916DX54_9BACT|nr:DHH family phosphoesterase [Aureispira anguillae]BDS15522.1 DHH family phosphoesterase [Aureispira anguillae]